MDIIFKELWTLDIAHSILWTLPELTMGVALHPLS